MGHWVRRELRDVVVPSRMINASMHLHVDARRHMHMHVYGYMFLRRGSFTRVRLLKFRPSFLLSALRYWATWTRVSLQATAVGKDEFSHGSLIS